MASGRQNGGHTALFEPWFCRILLELGAAPVGVDPGDLEQERFIHYRVDPARFMLAQVQDTIWLRQAPALSN